MSSEEPLYAFIQAAIPWLNEHIQSYILKHVPNTIFVEKFEDFPSNAKRVFQYCDGWELTRNFALSNKAEMGLINAYPNSDALARKDHLARVAEYWAAKRPDSNLKQHVPVTVRLTLDYCEYVEDALMEADNLELYYSLEENAAKDPSERQWWILKPALVDCGAGIRLFSTTEELASHLESVEFEDTDEDSSESEAAAGENGKIAKVEEGEGDNGPYMTVVEADRVNLDFLVTATGAISLDGVSGRQGKAKKPKYVFKENGRIPSSEMRAFVAQQYVTSIPVIDGRKWHARAYILCVGRLKVYVFKEMLALLAGEDYQPPWKNPSLKASLTNTGLQDEEDFIKKESMREFWKVEDDLLPGDWKQRVFDQICTTSSEIVCAAAYTMADKFVTMDKCFEMFAGDFLLDDQGNAWLLELNETPAFYQHGVAGPIAKRLMESLICITMEHMGAPVADDEQNREAKERFKLVVDESERLGKSNITAIVSEEEAAMSRYR